MKTVKSITLLLILFSVNSYAQLEQLFSAKADAEKYLNQYIAPGINGLMYNMNNGWYSTAKNHQVLGFDLSIMAMAAVVPNSETTFQFVGSQYQHLSIASGSTYLPTLAGGNSSSQLTVTNTNGDQITFDAPDGLAQDWPDQIPFDAAMPMAMVQLGVGLPGKFDVKVRFFPKSTFEDEITVSLFGLGVQHNISQYFMESKKDSSGVVHPPKFNLALIGAYTKTKTNYTPKNSGVAGKEQNLNFNMNNFTLQAIAGYDFKFINFYIGMGYTGGKTKIDALGTYQYDFDTNGSFSADETIVDPLHMAFDIAGFKTTAGVRLNLGPVKLFTDYTFQQYNSVTAGLAISVR